MNLKNTPILLFLIFSFAKSFSQQNIKLSGKIKSENTSLTDVLIEFNLKKNKTFAASDKAGNYQFKAQNFVLNDTLNIQINKVGFISFNKQIVIDVENMIFDINLEKNIETLTEVIVNSKNKILKTAGKSIYKINQKKFIDNTDGTEVLKTIPNVFYNENKGAIVEGNLKGKIFLDGLETNPNKIRSLKAAEIDKIEVISNPTAIYGTDFLGAVINIITKKTKEQYIKGSINLSGGVRNENFGAYPNFSFKKGIFNIKAGAGFTSYNQLSTGDLVRNDVAGNFIQNTNANSIFYQNGFNSTIGLLFSEKSDLIFSAFKGGFKIKGNTVGQINLNNLPTSNFTNIDTVINNDFEISSVYRNKITTNNTLFFKNKYAVLRDEYKSQYTDQSLNYFENKSKITELST